MSQQTQQENKIYTRTGDKGKTSLVGGKRVTKTDMRVEAYGMVDELNSVLGITIAESKDAKIKHALEQLQNDLFLIGSTLANPSAEENPYFVQRVDEFEQMIDFLSKGLPELHNFILPGGSMCGSYLHFSRTICRRVERRVVALTQTVIIDHGIQMYFNRLSDLLFIMARFVNHAENQKETIWKK